MRDNFQTAGRQLAISVLSAVLACGQAPSSGGIALLTYHRFDSRTPGSTTVTTASLQSQLTYLSENGYDVIPLSLAVDLLLGKVSLPSKPLVVITVDDGNRSVCTLLFPIIRQRRIPVTLFIYPSAISNSSYALTWKQIREMLASGLVDVQSHTYWHPDFRKERSRRSAVHFTAFVDAQLKRSRAKLNAELGINADLLAWPYGIVDDDLEAAARRAGYRAAFVYDGKLARQGEDPFAIHRVPVPDHARGAAFASVLRGVSSPQAKVKGRVNPE